MNLNHNIKYNSYEKSKLLLIRFKVISKIFEMLTRIERSIR